MKKFPKVLVISPCTFNLENGGGTTFTNLFQGWPRDKLANLHHSEQHESNAVCGSFFRFETSEIEKIKILGWSPKLNSIESDSSHGESKSPSIFQKARRLSVGNSGWPAKFQWSPRLQTWLDEFQPDVIYTILGPIPFLEAILQIQERYSTKLILHHMDDWYETAYSTGLFSYQKNRMKKLFREITNKADFHWTICDAMSRSYESRFGKRYTSFHNAIPVTEFEANLEKSPKIATGKKRVLYFGSVLPFSQEVSLLSVIDGITELQNEGHPYDIRVVAPKNQLQALRSKRPTVAGDFINGSSDQFLKEISQSDALLLPSNFDEEATRFLRYSMPTKIPGFLASGLPILMYAPKELAQVQYAESEGWAVVCKEESRPHLKEKIHSLFTEETKRIAREKNPMLARKNHDIQTVRVRFQEAICSLI